MTSTVAWLRYKILAILSSTAYVIRACNRYVTIATLLLTDTMESSGSCIPGHFWLRHCTPDSAPCWAVHLVSGSLPRNLERTAHRSTGHSYRHDGVLLCWQAISEAEDTIVSLWRKHLSRICHADVV